MTYCCWRWPTTTKYQYLAVHSVADNSTAIENLLDKIACGFGLERRRRENMCLLVCMQSACVNVCCNWRLIKICRCRSNFSRLHDVILVVRCGCATTTPQPATTRRPCKHVSRTNVQFAIISMASAVCQLFDM